jgi:hypothetical protein
MQRPTKAGRCFLSSSLSLKLRCRRASRVAAPRSEEPGICLGSEQRVCGHGDVVVIPGGTEHEAWFREDTEVIDLFAPPRNDFVPGGKPAYMSEN